MSGFRNSSAIPYICSHTPVARQSISKRTVYYKRGKNPVGSASAFLATLRILPSTSPDRLRKPPPLRLKISRIQGEGGHQIWTRFFGDFGLFLHRFTLQNRKIFARLRRDFSLYRVLKSKIFARLRRDFSPYRVLKHQKCRSRLRRDDES